MSVQERLDALSAASDYAAEQEKLGEYMRQVAKLNPIKFPLLLSYTRPTYKVGILTLLGINEGRRFDHFLTPPLCA